MVREAEEVITKQGDFDRAEAMLVGVLDFINRNNITDSWIKAAAQSNLGYVLHQKFDYQGALQHYSQGVAMLAKEVIFFFINFNEVCNLKVREFTRYVNLL
jgi:hypothetical protein